MNTKNYLDQDFKNLIIVSKIFKKQIGTSPRKTSKHVGTKIQRHVIMMASKTERPVGT